MEIQLTLDCICCSCRLPLTVTLKCTGVGVANPGEASIASVHVPCPDCGQVNQLIFDTRGEVKDVRPAALAQPAPEPSIN